MKVHNRSPNSIPLLVGFFLLLIGTAQITVLWTLSRAILIPLVESSLVEVQRAELKPQIYQLEIVDNRIRLVPETVETAATSPQQALEQALERLLARSSALDPASTIPPQTRLLDLWVSEDSIHLDLSREFTRGGGSSSMIYRVAQVLYTASSINPQASVFLSIEGKPLSPDNPLGGEGLLLDYPLTREQFARDFLQY